MLLIPHAKGAIFDLDLSNTHILPLLDCVSSYYRCVASADVVIVRKTRIRSDWQAN